MALCVEVGGTITGEHGVGVDKRGYMSLVHGDAELDMLRAVKEVFDPRGFFNPGKVLPVRESAPAPTGRTSKPAVVGS
jgi:FAD/FMN-containing dehydrogenase